MTEETRKDESESEEEEEEEGSVWRTPEPDRLPSTLAPKRSRETGSLLISTDGHSAPARCPRVLWPSGGLGRQEHLRRSAAARK